MKYRRIYQALTAHGHTSAKSLEIILDGKRKQQYAIEWIRRICIRRKRKYGND